MKGKKGCYASGGKLPSVEEIVARNRAQPQSSLADAKAAMKTIEEKMGKASGGRVDKVSGNPEVFKEAAEKHKKGGRVKKEIHAEGGKSAHRMDRPRRASGGRVGSDKNPFSSAHKGGAAGERCGGKPD